jgi:ectoine hydroxylase-related dioxygenase (phytanoyl-CoA dioxygenase family)
MKYLSKDLLDRFSQDGFLVIDDFLSPLEVQRVRNGIQRVSDEQATRTTDSSIFNLEKIGDDQFSPNAQAQKPGMLRKIQSAVTTVPEINEVFCGNKMLDCMEDLMGPELYYHSSKVMFKPPGGSAKPWHQDAAYWSKYAANQITVWIALDDADVDNGCVWAIPGSHKLGLIPHVAKELQVEQSRIDVAKSAPVPVKSGGLLIFHSLVLHMSHKNTSSRQRWAILCDYDCLPNPAFEAIESMPAGMGADKVWCLRGAAQTTASAQ